MLFNMDEVRRTTANFTHHNRVLCDIEQFLISYLPQNLILFALTNLKMACYFFYLVLTKLKIYKPLKTDQVQVNIYTNIYIYINFVCQC